jgi:beta-glucosidase
MTAQTSASLSTHTSSRPIPADFRLGVATAAYQIEGATHRDGRADSIWDAFCRVPGAVVGGDNGDRACEHYDRYRDDVALMGDLGVQVYRFSTSWARVQPDGRTANAAGLDFYSRLVDELLGAGITPWLTLYHWDLPQALEETGGWPARDTALRFADYAADVHSALGDRIVNWTTLNEPWCSAFLGYLSGEHAPGIQNPQASLDAAHHLLLGHGLATQRLRELGPDLSLGITLNMTVADPVDPTSAGDVDAARRIDAQHNRLFLDPIFRGEYPADLIADLDARGLHVPVLDGDLAAISTPIDALGINYYNGQAVSVQPPSATPLNHTAPSERVKLSPFPAGDGVYTHPRGLPTTVMNWEVQPDGLTRLLVRIDEEYTREAGVTLYVTENGAAYNDVVAADGSVDDADRAEFLRLHVDAILDAIDAGVNVKGYFYWSLMDNFEWAWGYDKRFGLVRVDYESQERTVKSSGRLYQSMIASRSVPRHAG